MAVTVTFHEVPGTTKGGTAHPASAYNKPHIDSATGKRVVRTGTSPNYTYVNGMAGAKDRPAFEGNGDPGWERFTAMPNRLAGGGVGRREGRLFTALLTAEGTEVGSVVNWDVYVLMEIDDSTDVPSRSLTDPAMAMGVWKPGSLKPVVRAGRTLYVPSADDPLVWVPAPSEYPAPVFKRLNGPRVLLEIQDYYDVDYTLTVDCKIPGEPVVSSAITVTDQGFDFSPPAPAPAPPPAPKPSSDVTDQVGGSAAAGNIDGLRDLGFTGPAFTSGQYVVAANAREYYWDGTDWSTGRAP